MIMYRIEGSLQKTGVCVVSGLGGVGKSTIVALYAHQKMAASRNKGLIVWWLPSDDGTILRTAVERFASTLGIVTDVFHGGEADVRSSCRDLACRVYQKLEKLKKGALLVLDNA